MDCCNFFGKQHHTDVLQNYYYNECTSPELAGVAKDFLASLVKPTFQDTVRIRIRPDPTSQNPVRIRPDPKILDPVHPYFCRVVDRI